MFQSSAKFPVMDYWCNEMASLSTANSHEDAVNRTSPDHHHRRSCSPEPFGERSSFGNALMKQLTFGPTQQSSQQQVSYLPETVNAFWTASRARLEKPNLPKRYVFEASPCCASPRIRVVHECCNRETPARELNEEPPQLSNSRRAYPAPKLTLCRFCLKNGEPPSVYYSHNLHLEDGRVSCPILRRYDCPICKSGGGDHAHTVRYCPALRANTRR